MAGGTSRDSKERAGWRTGAEPSSWVDISARRVDPRWTEFSWLAIRSLLDSANDKIAKNVHDLVNARRMRWVASQRASGADPDFRVRLVDPDAETLAFLLVGDPGEADPSQYVLVAPLMHKAPDTDFMLLASDVIYPAGDVNDYENAFFLPYAWYPEPILGQPGNHDWYDGLAGFMWHFCGSEPLPPTEYRPSSFSPVERVARFLWRQASRPNRPRLLAWRSELAANEPRLRRWEPPQPGPYWSLESRDLKVIVIDTGITGAIDREQGEWLLREAAGPKRKILITGKPIYVGSEYHPGEIVWKERDNPRPLLTTPAHPTVDSVVRDPDHGFVAVIGGDTHNYQRHTVRVGPRTIEYIVSGGGGAYMSATHLYGHVDIPASALPEHATPVTEEDFRCYPMRGDSVAYYVERLGRVVRQATLAAAGAAALVVVALLAGVVLSSLGVGRASFGGAVATVLGTVAFAVLLGLAAWKGASLAPRWYRFFCVTSGVAGVTLVALWALTHVAHWPDVRTVIMATVAVVLAPTAVVLASYYVAGTPRFVLDLGIALLAGASVVALLGWEPWGGGDWALFVGVSLVLLVVTVPALGAIRRSGDRVRYWYRRIVIALLAVDAAFAVTVWWEHRWVRALAVAAGTLVLVGALAVLLVVLLSGAGAALLRGDLVDPTERVDAIARLTHEHLGLDALPPRLQGVEPDERSARIVALFFNPWFARLGGAISAVADRNAPPFFKQFLRIDVREGILTIECFAATGWQEDAEDPPCEDRVVIALGSDGPGT